MFVDRLLNILVSAKSTTGCKQNRWSVATDRICKQLQMISIYSGTSLQWLPVNGQPFITPNKIVILLDICLV